MKTLILMITTSLMTPFANADQPRDLKKYPLTKNEAKAYRASKSFAQELGVKISRRCVNASFVPVDVTETSISVQFESINSDGKVDCGDPHYSIGVEINSEGQVSSISLIDS